MSAWYVVLLCKPRLITSHLCCDTGYAVSSFGQDRCVACESGKKAGIEGLANCEPCAEGKFSVQSNNSDAGPTECTACEPGFESSNTGRLTALQCDSAPLYLLTWHALCQV